MARRGIGRGAARSALPVLVLLCGLAVLTLPAGAARTADRQPVVIEVDENVSSADAPAAAPPAGVSGDESVGVVDAVVVTPPGAVSAVESVGVADVVAIVPSMRVAANEGVKVTDTVSVVVRAGVPPTLSLPADVVTEATEHAGAVVRFSATARDGAGGADRVTCVPKSGSTFPLGTTTVSCSATDAAGGTASGSFTVTVRDTTPPTLRLPRDRVAEATSPAGAVVRFRARAHDIVDGSVPALCTPASDSTFAIGQTTVACSAADAAGNVARGSFTVTVHDTRPPRLELPANPTVRATGPSGAIVTFAATATDLVDGSDRVTCTPASGSTFPIGRTTVDCSASDAAGNGAAGHFTVTVTRR